MSSTPVDANTSFFSQDLEAVLTTVEGTSMTPAQGTATSSSVRPLCEPCGKSFGRPQDFKRHVKDVHLPRRQCPFCSYEWCRPEKIKAHLTDVHRDVLSVETLQGICALRGRDVFIFLDTFESLHRGAAAS